MCLQHARSRLILISYPSTPTPLLPSTRPRPSLDPLHAFLRAHMCSQCTRAMCPHVPDCANHCYEAGASCDPNAINSYGGGGAGEAEPEPCAAWCRNEGDSNTCGEGIAAMESIESTRLL